MDHCDRCPARPVTLWAPLTTDMDERDLELCAAHTRAHEAALTEQGWVLVIDERD